MPHLTIITIRHYKAEIEKRKKLRGKQAIEIEILKKTEELLKTR